MYQSPVSTLESSSLYFYRGILKIQLKVNDAPGWYSTPIRMGLLDEEEKI